MNLVDSLGAVAAVLTTGSFLPQAVRVVRTGDTQAISLAMYAMFTVGVACWGAYGLLTQQSSIVAANAVTLCLAAIILAMKLKAIVRAKTSSP